MLSLAHLADLVIALASVAIFGFALGQVWRPWQTPVAGTVVRRVRLPLRARIRLHGVWLLGVALLLLCAGGLGVLVTTWPFLVAVLAATALLAYPVHYTVTDHGLAVGRTPLRRWTEFGGLSARNGWIYLQPVAGARGVLIRAPEHAAAAEFAAELRRMVRDAYKGQLGPNHGTLDRASADEALPGGAAVTVVQTAP